MPHRLASERALWVLLLALSAVVMTQVAAETLPQDTVPEQGDWNTVVEESPEEDLVSLLGGAPGKSTQVQDITKKLLSQDGIANGASHSTPSPASKKAPKAKLAKNVKKAEEAEKKEEKKEEALAKKADTKKAAASATTLSKKALLKKEQALAKKVKKLEGSKTTPQIHATATKKADSKVVKDTKKLAQKLKQRKKNAGKAVKKAIKEAKDLKQYNEWKNYKKAQKLEKQYKDQEEYNEYKNYEQKKYVAHEQQKQQKQLQKKVSSKVDKEAVALKKAHKAKQERIWAEKKEYIEREKAKAAKEAVRKAKDKADAVAQTKSLSEAAHFAAHNTHDTLKKALQDSVDPYTDKTNHIIAEKSYASSHPAEKDDTIADVLRHLREHEESSVAAQKAIQGRAFKSLREHGVHWDEKAVNDIYDRVSQKDRNEKIEKGEANEISEKKKLDEGTRTRNRHDMDPEVRTKLQDKVTKEAGAKWSEKEAGVKKEAKAEHTRFEKRIAQYHAKVDEKKGKVSEKKSKLKQKEQKHKDKVQEKKHKKMLKHKREEKQDKADEKLEKKHDYQKRVSSIKKEDKLAKERLRKHKKMAKAWKKRAEEHEKQEEEWEKIHEKREKARAKILKKKKAYDKKEKKSKAALAKTKQKELDGKERRQKAKESKQKEDAAARHLGWISRLEAARAREKYESSHAYLHSAAERLARSDLNRFLPGYAQKKGNYRTAKPIHGHHEDNEIAGMPPPVKIKTPKNKKKEDLFPDKEIKKMPSRFSRYAEEAHDRDEYKDSLSSGKHVSDKVRSSDSLQGTLQSSGKNKKL